MDYGFYEEYGTPFSGRKLRKLREFLQSAELDYDEQIEYTVNLTDNEGTIVATGSVHNNVLKCIAVSDKHQGMGLSARILTALLNYAAQQGRDHLFLFTKPKNAAMFGDLGFYKILETDTVLLMENKRGGIEKYVASLERPANEGSTVGAIIANCNPFTLGHRWLIEEAASKVDTLHLFILSEDKSTFPADVRYELAKAGTADLPNVILHRTSDYLISSAVFPTYFIKDKAKAADANCELDIRIFGQYFAKALGITKRFVGTEPFCPVTNAYNSAMARLLPEYGVELVQLPRKEMEGRAVSASYVRACMAQNDLCAIQAVVPQTTYDYIVSPAGCALAEKLASQAEA
ncbi:MAG: [Clostridia bacterium]|nr:[citrate (pro-3S)-lyase] ligase [Clostridia bacterium]